MATVVNKWYLSGIVLAVSLAAFLWVSSTALAHPGEPDNVWTGSLPEACITVWDPVHDIEGNTYSNVCFAALEEVRVTRNGEGH